MHEKWRQMRVEVEGRRERQTLMRDGRQGGRKGKGSKGNLIMFVPQAAE